MKLKVKVVPGASTDGISGWLGDRLKVRVTQPPEKGKANTAVENLLCRSLDLPAGSVRVVSGSTSPLKTVEIDGLSAEEINQRL